MSLIVAPLESLTDTRLTDPERRVLWALFSFRGKNTDCVWPSLIKLGERAQIQDVTRISKITSSLAKKGWLTKKKRSFRQGNEYRLTMPEELANLDSEANLEDEKPGKTSESNLDSNANLAKQSKMKQGDISNLDSETKPNLDSETKPIEQTTEQTTEQTMPPSDDGRKNRMGLSWLPGEYFEDRCTQAGIRLRDIPEKNITDFLGEFRSFWMSKVDRLTHGQWEHKFLQQLQRRDSRDELYRPLSEDSIRKRPIADRLTDRSWAE